MSLPLPALHAFAAAYMTGVIWFVQIIHYPTLAPPAEGTFVERHQDYTQRMGWIVGPIMLLEMGLQLLQLQKNPGPKTFLLFGLLLLIWISTFALQVPAHNLLSQGYDAQAVQRLVRTNWIRTLAWTARSVILLKMI
jgi:hypothetical protein